MLLSFDIVPEAVEEHDHWHTHEHLPERLGIPEFLRGTRWIALEGGPRYLVLYEVVQLGTLASEPYLARLNNPTLWSAKMMPNYRRMSRGLCSVIGSFGLGMGHLCAVVRFKPEARAAAAMRRWLAGEALPSLPSRAGIASAHLIEGALTPAMTNEQRIRGADAGVDSALLLTAYDRDALTELVDSAFSASSLEQRGATGVARAIYRIDYSLARAEIGA